MENMMQSKSVRRIHARSGWTKAEEELLRERLVQAEQNRESLRTVFEEVAQQTGRRPNSVRNYYYTVLRSRMADTHPVARRPRPAFEPFTAAEARSMLKTMLTWHSQGKSIRACAAQLARGDRTRMLRYQNKYRSLMKSRPPMVKEVLDELAQQGIVPDVTRPARTAALGAEELTQHIAQTVSNEVCRIISLDATETARLRVKDAQERAELYRQRAYRLASLTREYLRSNDSRILALVQDCIQESLDKAEPGQMLS
ncbi:MAG: SANT/Myb-like DNA-binding domain-containing protein [Eubacteriales bacterium]|nr:SANT/Myb-like DNA-binding domain-containing protein [Eubacteriales bacterium]